MALSGAGALDQSDVDDGLYAAAMRNGLVADDGQRQVWVTIAAGSALAWVGLGADNQVRW
jgi:hypothetical protein